MNIRMPRFHRSACSNSGKKILTGRSILAAAAMLCAMGIFSPPSTAQQEPITNSLPQNQLEQDRLEKEQFIPIEQMDALFERGRSGVLMPRDQFEELLQKARANHEVTAGHPAGIVAESVRIQVTPVDQHAVLVMDIRVRQFVDSWQVLTIPAGQLLVESIEITDASGSDEGIRVSRNPQNARELMIVGSAAQEFTVRLTASTALATIGSDRAAAFHLPGLAATELSIECPAGQQLLVNDLESTRPAPDDQATTYNLPLGQIDNVRLRWTTRRQENDTQTLVFVGTDATVRVQKEALRWSSESVVSVFGGTINQVVARVPARMEITSVESTGLESWKLEDDADVNGMTRVTLSYRQPFTNERLISISGIAAVAEDGPQQIPTLEFVDVTSHSGRLVVSHESGLRLTATTGTGIRTVGADYKAGPSATGVSVFDFWVQQFDLTVAIRPRDRELFAELDSTLSLQDRTAVFVGKLTIETLNAPLFDLTLSLPEDWQLTGLTSGGQPLDWRAGAEANQIAVPLPNSVPAGGLLEVSVELAHTIPDPQTEQRLAFPVVVPETATIVGGSYSVQFADDLLVSPITLAGLESAGGTSGLLRFRNVGTKLSGEISIQRRPARLATRSVLRSWADTRQLTTEVQITVDVMHGTIPDLTIRLPEWMGEDVHFGVVSIGTVPGFESQIVTGPVSIVEQSPQPVSDGLRPYVLKLSQRFAGSITLSTMVQQSREQLVGIPAPRVDVQDAVRQQGVLIFEAFPEQQLQAVQDVSQIDGLFAADAALADSPAAATSRRVALIYRFVHSNYQLTVQDTRFETEAVPSAIITEVRNRCLISETGTFQRICEADFQSTGVQTVRFILPDADQSVLWSTMLNAEPVEVRRDGLEYLVAIPAATARQSGMSQYTITVVFETQSDTAGLTGDIQQYPVQFAIGVENDTAAAVNVLQQVWDVHYPGSSLLIDSRGFLTPVHGTDQPGWFYRLMDLTPPAPRTIVQRLIPLAIFLLICFVLTALLVQRRWKMLAAVVASGMLLMVLMSFYSVAPREYAASEYFGEISDAVTLVEPAMTAGDGGFEGVGFYEGYSGRSSSGSGGMGGGGGFGGGGGGGYGGALGSPMGGSGLGGSGMHFGGMGGGMGGAEAPSRIAGPVSPVPGSGRSEQALEEEARASSDRFRGRSAFEGAEDKDRAAAPRAEYDIELRGGTDMIFPMEQPPQDGQQASDPFGAPSALAASGQPPGVELSGAELAAFQNQRRSESGIDPALLSAPRGGARLSVQMGLQVPDDFQTREFRSVGDSVATPSPLQIVVFSQQQIAAIRVLAAVCVVLFFWWIRNARAASRMMLAVVLTLVAAALIPFVPNQWQCVLDGIILGSVFGAIVWMGRAICEGICGLANGIRRRLTRSTARTAGTTALLMVSLSGTGLAQLTITDHGGDAASLQPSIVVPYAPDQPGWSGDKVFIKRQDFENLFLLAYPDLRPRQSSAPDGSGVVAAFYQTGTLTAVSDSQHVMLVQARYMIYHNSSAAAQIPLPLGAVAIVSVTVDGEPGVVQPVAQVVTPDAAPPNSNPDGNQQQSALQIARPPAGSADEPHSADGPAYTVVVKGKGHHVVDLQFQVAVQLQGEAGRFEIPLRPVTAGTLTLTLPSTADQPAGDAQPPAVEVRVNGRTNVYRRDGDTIILPIADSHNTRIQWQPTTVRSSDDVVFHASSQSALLIEDAGLKWVSSIDVTCRQGDFSELDIAIPESWVVQSVTGNEIAGWSVQNTDANRVVRLQFQRAIQDQVQISLTLFQELNLQQEKTSLNIPVPAVRGATRDLGTVAVLAGNQFQVRTETLSGVAQLNPQDAPIPAAAQESAEASASRAVLAWRFTRHPVSIQVLATRTVDQIAATALHAMRLETQRQLWTSQFDVRITGAPQSRFDIVVPANFLTLDVQATGLSDWFLTSPASEDAAAQDAPAAEAARQTLTLQLQQATTGLIHIVLQGHLDRVADRTSLTLQAPQVLQATEATAQLAVWLDPASENAGVQPGDWQTRGLTSIADSYRQLVAAPPSVAFFTNKLQPGPVMLTLRPAVPTLIGESVTVTNTTDTSIDVTLALNWQIARAAADTFLVDLPTATSQALNFDVPNLRRLVKEDLEGGTTRITIQLQQPETERLFVLATGSLPLPDDGIVKPRAPQFVTPTGAAGQTANATMSSQSHFWVVVNQSSGLLQPVGDHRPTEVSAGLMTTTIPEELLRLAVTVQKLNTETPAWTLQFPEQHQVSPAVVTLATHVTVLADDGSWRSRHILSVRNESRQFLPVRIPADSRMLYCLVDRKPTRIVMRTTGERTEHLIPVPQSGAIATVFEVEFAMAGQLPGSAEQIRRQWNTRKLTIPVPVFPEFREDPAFGISISRNRWSVFVPESWRATWVDDPQLTNVIPASHLDFADASLLSSVEQTNWLLNSFNSTKGIVSRRALVRELQTQEKVIGQIQGNSAAVNQERDETLKKLRDATIDIDFDLIVPADDGTEALQRGGNTGNSLMYLYEQDLNQNGLWLRNDTDFLLENRDSSRALQQVEGLEKAFNFQLSEPQRKLKESPDSMQQLRKHSDDSAKANGRRSGMDREKALPEPTTAAPASPQEVRPDFGAKQEATQQAAGETGQRSQLLERRQSQEFSQLDDLSESVNAPADPLNRFGRTSPERPLNLNGMQSGLIDETLMAQQAVDEARQFSNALTFSHIANPAASTGLLSLQFEIPTAGHRMDFIRPGGNPGLTLQVQSHEAVRKGFGLVWAVGCIAVALFLVAGLGAGRSVLIRRILLVTAIAAVAGWLLSPANWSGIFVVATIVLVFTYCGSLILTVRRHSHES